MRLIALLLSLLAASSASAKGYRRVQLRNKDNDQCLYAQALRLEGTDPLPNTPADTRECTSYGNPSGLWDVNTGVSGKIKSSSFAQVIYADPSSPFDGYNMVTAQSPRAGSGLQQWTVMDNGTIFYSDHTNPEKGQYCLTQTNGAVVLSRCLEPTNEAVSSQIWTIDEI